MTFEQASAKDFSAKAYDHVVFLDCLHDMGDPVGAGRHLKQTLARDGVCIDLPNHSHTDTLKDNLNPLGGVFYGASIFICTLPRSRSRWRLAWAPRQQTPVTFGSFSPHCGNNMIFEARA